jgi:hypothetical protein
MAERPRRHDLWGVKFAPSLAGGLTATASLSLAPAALLGHSQALSTGHQSPASQRWGTLLLWLAVGGAAMTWTYVAYYSGSSGYLGKAHAVLAATGMRPRLEGCKPQVLSVCGPDGGCRLEEYPCGVPPPPSLAPPRPPVKELSRAQMLSEQLAEHHWQ